ncbi:GFA family protein [Mesorhizobium sp.]|uniref:GFA family protein n=1 Tax=Mesorhizobium sp. TaxID=1871066 RepID=UPI000FE49DE5|nr:MAG: aldehyde-activating protein [Mesorhizobium sp.]RWK68738.1 MAG: aldehyde-activating protein [Mesorhizobium sp.]RWK75525.1 MAG: aldehyde-activating protein [Mesorhizobium sp.]RWK83890.1 MAG: aldehyde-activating protein [Mesorhizobium sp.]RWL06410.1 MAG: aldehyde-activating protein [Mesorhizobium sp.]
MRGSCLCGNVEFQIGGEPPRIYQCHCSLCRKQGGSSSSSAIIAEARNFCWIAGQEHIASYVRPTGFRSDFCSRCGSPVPNPLRATAYYWVPTGLLDDSMNLEVGAHLFVGSKVSWEMIPSNGVQYETAPKLSELIELVHSGS